MAQQRLEEGGDGDPVGRVCNHNFDELYSGTGSDVISVNAKTGVVVLTTTDIADATNKRYVTDVQRTVIGNTSGTNTGDQTLAGLGAEPLSKTASGLGQVVLINTASGAAAVLPAGGTWFYFITPYVLATGVLSGTPGCSVAAGGTTVGAASAGITWVGFCKEAT